MQARRRHLIQTLATLPLLASHAGVFAAGAASTASTASIASPISTSSGTRPRLLMVFLRGAYDCANLLVPTSSDFYYAARPTLAIARPGQPQGALPVDADWGLHPAMEASLAPMVARGEAVFVPFAGTDDLSRSHFETQDGIERGQVSQAARDMRTGFLNRLVGVLDGQAGATRCAPIAFTEQMPLVMRGDAPALNMALSRAPGRAVDAGRAQAISAMYRDTDLAAAVDQGFKLKGEVDEALKAEMDAAGRQALSTQGFEQVARRMARLMQGRFDLGFVDVGGWDTHVGQGGATGLLATRLGALGQGLSAFAQEMGPAWRDTVVVVLSEFGRTFRENGNRGTDHGHGSVYWVLGGGLASGRPVRGEQVAVAERTLFQNRDYPVLNDYRSVFGGLFQRMYGLSAAQVGQVFPGAAPIDLELV